VRLAWGELRDFRNHRETRVEPPAGLTAAVGENGQGKTNLLEGLYYLFSLESPRVSSDEPLVRAGAESAFVRGEVVTETGKLLIEVEVRPSGANRVQLNRSGVRRKRDIRQLARAVFFGPDDIAIVQGDPGERRRFMDAVVTALWPAREATRTAYDKALRQRNRLLKDWDGRAALDSLEAWDEELVKTGSSLIRDRAEAVERLRDEAADTYAELSQGHRLEVGYLPSVEPGEDVSDRFRARLAERRRDELLRRTTLAGPHRDDLQLQVRDLKARSFASHGEAWAGALCLRLATGRAVAREIGEPPVLFLDDPFSGLDPGRRRRLAAGLAGRGQTLISVPDRAQVPEGASLWTVEGGTVAAA
jgi:DNA replication and repair protein RecF